VSTDQLRVAEEVLELLRAEGSGIEGAVCVDHKALALTRFANSYIHQNVADATTTVRLLVHVDGRTTAGSTTLTQAEGLRELVTRTVAASRAAPPDPGWPGLTPPLPLHGTGNLDGGTVGATPADRADRIRSFVDAAGGLETAGYCGTMHWSGAFANTAGQSGTGATTDASMDGIVRLRTGSGIVDGTARLTATALSEVDGSVLGARAAAKARASVDPMELAPGRYEVVLEPCAVGDILQNLALYGFNGKVYGERRSFVVLGEPQFDPSITLVDDPLGPGDLGLPFDAEGTPTGRLVLVDAGRSASITYDRRTAAVAGNGAQSTGHSVPVDFNAGSFATSLRIATNGGAALSEVDGPVAESASAALVAKVERGILVTDFWYTRVLDPMQLAITGLTRNGIWLIEHGEVTRPLTNFRFTQAYPAALAPGAVLGIGAQPTPQPSGWGLARWGAPPLHLASWNFTGGASG